LTLTNPGWAPGLSPPLQLAVIEQAVAFLSFNLPRGAPSSDACELQAACHDAAEALAKLKAALSRAPATRAAACF
jgi:hypothetical protein